MAFPLDDNLPPRATLVARSHSRALFFFGLLGCVVACLAISPGSLWEDEAEVALMAAPSSAYGWWQAFTADHTSNVMAPLYTFLLWVWARVFGISEIALRGMNVIWFFTALIAILYFLRRRPGLRTATLLVFCIHPFVWYYLSEARPYSMQLAGAMLVTGGLFEALDEPPEPLSACWWWLFVSGVVILCGSNLLGIPWVAAAGVLLLLRPGFFQSMRRSGIPALVVGVPLLAALAFFYAWTLSESARPAERSFSFLSVPFVFYEHLGFTGLGPGQGGHAFRRVPRLFALPTIPQHSGCAAHFCAGVRRSGWVWVVSSEVRGDLFRRHLPVRVRFWDRSCEAFPRAGAAYVTASSLYPDRHRVCAPPVVDAPHRVQPRRGFIGRCCAGRLGIGMPLRVQASARR